MPANIKKEDALSAIYRAFNCLKDQGLANHEIKWVGEHLLLTIGKSPKDVLTTWKFLTHPSKQVSDALTTGFEFGSYKSLTDNYGSVKELFEKEQHVAFAYIGGSYTEPTINKKLQQVKEETRKCSGIQDVVAVHANNPDSKGNNSIAESITNLIAARFLMLKGYMIFGPSASGPDLIALKTNILNTLREMHIIGRGSTIHELSTITTLGRTPEAYQEEINKEEIIAVETESIYPEQGISQLEGDYKSEPYRHHMEIFDKRVLAVPFYHQFTKQAQENLDVLTYDNSDLGWIERKKKDWATPDYLKDIRSKLMGDLLSEINQALLANLNLDEILAIIPGKPQTLSQLLSKLKEIELSRILETLKKR